MIKKYTRSSIETPPDWSNLNNNSIANLHLIIKELNVNIPENAERDELIRLINLKISSPHLTPFKNFKFSSSQNNNVNDDDNDTILPSFENDSVEINNNNFSPLIINNSNNSKLFLSKENSSRLFSPSLIQFNKKKKKIDYNYILLLIGTILVFISVYIFLNAKKKLCPKNANCGLFSINCNKKYILINNKCIKSNKSISSIQINSAINLIKNQNSQCLGITPKWTLLSIKELFPEINLKILSKFDIIENIEGYLITKNHKKKLICLLLKFGDSHPVFSGFIIFIFIFLFYFIFNYLKNFFLKIFNETKNNKFIHLIFLDPSDKILKNFFSHFKKNI